MNIWYVCCICWFGLFCGDTFRFFFLLGHTYEDIDQRFNVISRTLKRQDIDSMQQLLDLVTENTSPTKSLRTSCHLEYI